MKKLFLCLFLISSFSKAQNIEDIMVSTSSLVLEPLSNQNLNSYFPVDTTGSGSALTSTSCIGGGATCFYTRSLASGTSTAANNINYYAYGSYNYQGPNAFIQAALGGYEEITGSASSMTELSGSIKFQNKSLIGQVIGGATFTATPDLSDPTNPNIINTVTNWGISATTQTKDGFNQLAVGGNQNTPLSLSVQSQSISGFSQSVVNLSNYSTATNNLTSESWSVAVLGQSSNNAIQVSSSETRMYNKVNMMGNQINNLAPGVLGTDAVNMNQMNQVLKQSFRGIASVAALNGIPSLRQDKEFNIGLGIGSYKGESALAIGGHYHVDNQITVKAGIGFSGNATTASAGIGFAF